MSTRPAEFTEANLQLATLGQARYGKVAGWRRTFESEGPKPKSESRPALMPALVQRACWQQLATFPSRAAQPRGLPARRSNQRVMRLCRPRRSGRGAPRRRSRSLQYGLGLSVKMAKSVALSTMSSKSSPLTGTAGSPDLICTWPPGLRSIDKSMKKQFEREEGRSSLRRSTRSFLLRILAAASAAVTGAGR